MTGTWHVQFYNRRLGAIETCTVAAGSPQDAVRAGWRAVLAAHPPGTDRKRISLFARAERAAGHHDSGWELYRIRGGGAPEGPGPA